MRSRVSRCSSRGLGELLPIPGLNLGFGVVELSSQLGKPPTRFSKVVRLSRSSFERAYTTVFVLCASLGTSLLCFLRPISSRDSLDADSSRPSSGTETQRSFTKHQTEGRPLNCARTAEIASRNIVSAADGISAVERTIILLLVFATRFQNTPFRESAIESPATCQVGYAEHVERFHGLLSRVLYKDLINERRDLISSCLSKFIPERH